MRRLFNIISFIAIMGLLVSAFGWETVSNYAVRMFNGTVTSISSGINNARTGTWNNSPAKKITRAFDDVLRGIGN